MKSGRLKIERSELGWGRTVLEIGNTEQIGLMKYQDSNRKILKKYRQMKLISSLEELIYHQSIGETKNDTKL